MIDICVVVPIEEIGKLSKMKALQVTPQELVEAATRSKRLQLNEENTKIGRIKPYVQNKKEELDDWSIYVEGFTRPYTDEKAIRELFNSLVGHVSFLRIPPNQRGDSRFFGYCFIEFDDKANIQKAIGLLNNYPKRKNEASLQVDDPEKRKQIKKLHLRVMSKYVILTTWNKTLNYIYDRTDWNKYKDQYLQLLNERKQHVKSLWDKYKQEEEKDQTSLDVETPANVNELGYKKGIIVHVDNLHPNAPKTIAIKLLEQSGISIAFMTPKKKGLTSVHIRLGTPEDAIRICEYFDANFVIQETEKDTTGEKTPEKTSECLRLRIIKGTLLHREKEYADRIE